MAPLTQKTFISPYSTKIIKFPNKPLGSFQENIYCMLYAPTANYQILTFQMKV